MSPRFSSVPRSGGHDVGAVSAGERTRSRDRRVPARSPDLGPADTPTSMAAACVAAGIGARQCWDSVLCTPRGSASTINRSVGVGAGRGGPSPLSPHQLWGLWLGSQHFSALTSQIFCVSHLGTEGKDMVVSL